MVGFQGIVFIGIGAIVIGCRVLSCVIRRRASTIDLVFLFLATVIVVGLLLPPAVQPRFYFQGKDQYEWMNQLSWDESIDNRREAAFALGEILGNENLHCRLLIIRALGDAAGEAKPAMPVLKRLVNDDNLELRQEVRLAIQRIDFEKGE